MRCPHCGELGSRVLDSRPAEENRCVRRRRECPHCKGRFTTYERIDAGPLMVKKRDGRREMFQRDKVLRGVVTACEKRPVSMDELQRLVNDVEYQIRADTAGEVTSREVGERVMDRLRTLDEVAYVRFASVYRLFADVEAFHREVAQLRRDRDRDEEGRR